VLWPVVFLSKRHSHIVVARGFLEGFVVNRFFSRLMRLGLFPSLSLFFSCGEGIPLLSSLVSSRSVVVFHRSRWERRPSSSSGEEAVAGEQDDVCCVPTAFKRMGDTEKSSIGMLM